jgi:hypothetical protein
LAHVVREGGRRYVEVLHAYAAKWNGWAGTPLREPLNPRVSRRLGCQKCGIVTELVSYQELKDELEDDDGVSQGVRTITR